MSEPIGPYPYALRERPYAIAVYTLRMDTSGKWDGPTWTYGSATFSAVADFYGTAKPLASQAAMRRFHLGNAPRVFARIYVWQFADDYWGDDPPPNMNIPHWSEYASAYVPDISNDI